MILLTTRNSLLLSGISFCQAERTIHPSPSVYLRSAWSPANLCCNIATTSRCEALAPLPSSWALGNPHNCGTKRLHSYLHCKLHRISPFRSQNVFSEEDRGARLLFHSRGSWSWSRHHLIWSNIRWSCDAVRVAWINLTLGEGCQCGSLLGNQERGTWHPIYAVVCR